MQSLDVVFQYRSLMGKCEAGVGLTFDEIDALTLIEASFGRVACDLPAMVRGGDLNDKVKITELAAGGMVVRHAPFVDVGMQVEVVIDDARQALSYRSKARVAWVRELNDDFALGLELCGSPIVIHYGPASAERTGEMDRIAA